MPTNNFTTNDNTVNDFLNTTPGGSDTPIHSPTKWPLLSPQCEISPARTLAAMRNFGVYTDSLQLQEEKVRRWYDIPFPRAGFGAWTEQDA